VKRKISWLIILGQMSEETHRCIDVYTGEGTENRFET
jgi:hypothetical protein